MRKHRSNGYSWWRIPGLFAPLVLGLFLEETTTIAKTPLGVILRKSFLSLLDRLWEAVIVAVIASAWENRLSQERFTASLLQECCGHSSIVKCNRGMVLHKPNEPGEMLSIGRGRSQK